MRLLFAMLVAFSFAATAAPPPYRIHKLSEKEIVREYTLMLRDACQFAEQDWHAAAFDPAAGYWGDGKSAGNGGIRTVASMALACATLVQYDDGLSATEHDHLFDRAAASIRYSTATHVTGPQLCPDGKHWGSTEPPGPGNWQSGMWTGTLATAAFLVWDRLPPAQRDEVERVMAWECDILAKGHPPTGLWWDTKAEENGWEVPCLVLGELMFPHNPSAAAWREKAEEYMMNTLCTAADLQDTNLVDGRAVNQWVCGANLQPDFTLENHGFFHPAYVGCSSYFLTQAAMYFTRAGQPVPEAATHHLLDTWRMFETILLPWGESAYPQGMDWELHGLPYFNLFASLATRQQDAAAAGLEQKIIQYFRAWQLMHQGELDIPGSRYGITRHAVNAEQASYGLLAHKIFGSAAKPSFSRPVGVWDYAYVDFIAHRTEEKFASFSWKNKIMGLLMPIGPGHEDNPDFTVPIPNGFVGAFELSPRGDVKTTVLEHSRKALPDGFETSGTLLLEGGRLKQTLKMTSLGAGTVVYEDRVVALSNVTGRAEKGLPLGIENDEITGGERILSDAAGKTVIDWKKTGPPRAISGNWANVSGRLGIVTLAGSGLEYAPAKGYSPGISVGADILYGSYSTKEESFKAGEEVARRIAILVVEASRDQTAALAKSCKIETTPSGTVLTFRPPDGESTSVPLN